MFAETAPPELTQRRLLRLAAVFLTLYATALTLAPLLRGQKLAFGLDLLAPWLALVTWLACFGLAERQVNLRLAQFDPYLLPLAGLLSGWGLQAISRLEPALGLRQTLWLIVGTLIFLAGLRLPDDLRLLRRYKYLWLSAGLALTALTLFFGVNPLGGGPQLWLGCCGMYIQPSEPLKLLLVIYLAAYLADRQFVRPLEDLPPLLRRLPHRLANFLTGPLPPLLAPTALVIGLALLIMVIQRDLGTASILLFLYISLIYLASDERLVLWLGGTAILFAAIAGYLLFAVVQVRVDGWLNPWADPSGGSYQIIQAMIASASGGLLGSGPGLGSPWLVPVAHSDFIFSTIAEENGILGALGLLIAIALLTSRSLVSALYAAGTFRRLLAAGLAAYLGGQAVLITGGGLRLLPLTGVTLPFVSYGGSSLVTSLVSLLLLLKISSQAQPQTLPKERAGLYLQLGQILLSGMFLVGLLAGWWGLVSAPDLTARPDNARRMLADRYVQRGSLLDRHNEIIATSSLENGLFVRQALYPELGPTIGYAHGLYGQAGLEASLEEILRGLSGLPLPEIWSHQLLYSLPPPGLDVRLTLDLSLQAKTDAALAGRRGAAVLLNADTGEILVLASQPAFDPNTLAEDWSELVNDPAAPLLNRAVQGQYPPGAALGPLLLAKVRQENLVFPLPALQPYSAGSLTLDCAYLPPASATLVEQIRAGCPAASAALGETLGEAALLELFGALGFYSAPQVPLPVAGGSAPQAIENPAYAALGLASLLSDRQPPLLISPLQMALAQAMLANQGVLPAPRLALSYRSGSEWRVFQINGQNQNVLPSATAQATWQMLANPASILWQTLAVIPPTQDTPDGLSWFIGGTQPAWQGSPLTLVVLLEEANPALVEEIGQTILQAAIQP